MAKYYAVAKGASDKPKILTTWDECKKEVMGVKGAIYKSFSSKLEAENFIALHTGKSIKKENDEGIYIYVDGSFMLEKENFSYGMVVLKDGEVIHTANGVGFDEEAVALRNVSGEVQGAMEAVKYSIEQNFKEITICFDYQGIESWALGTWKRNNRITQEYNKFMSEKMKEIKINFKKIKGHSGDKYNDMADNLAKEALVGR